VLDRSGPRVNGGRMLKAEGGRKTQGARLYQSVDDNWSGHRCGWPCEQRRQTLFDPRQHALVRLLGSRVIVEDADRSYVSSGV